jgi:hypothetical protein
MVGHRPVARPWTKNAKCSMGSLYRSFPRGLIGKVSTRRKMPDPRPQVVGQTNSMFFEKLAGLLRQFAKVQRQIRNALKWKTFRFCGALASWLFGIQTNEAESLANEPVPFGRVAAKPLNRGTVGGADPPRPGWRRSRVSWALYKNSPRGSIGKASGRRKMHDPRPPALPWEVQLCRRWRCLSGARVTLAATRFCQVWLTPTLRKSCNA